MKTETKTLKTQLFVCTNPSGCAYLGGQKLRDTVKSALIQKLGVENYKKFVRINNSGCLGDCDHGIAACLMPQNKFWTELKPEDNETLINEVLNIIK